VRHIADRVLVMYLGRVIESGPVDRLYEQPLHPYTEALLASRLSMDPQRRVTRAPLAGDPPSPIDPPSGCRFRTRCPIAEEICARVEPALDEPLPGSDRKVACHARAAASGHSLAPPVGALP
jgi:peptide/nickel transport system ATP-binding protein